MYVKCDNESKYKQDAYSVIEQFNTKTKKKLMIAIEDMFSDGESRRYSWQFIATALRKKSVDNWQLMGFGLMWNASFCANVHKQMERDDKLEHISELDVINFFDSTDKGESKEAGDFRY